MLRAARLQVAQTDGPHGMAADLHAADRPQLRVVGDAEQADGAAPGGGGLGTQLGPRQVHRLAGVGQPVAKPALLAVETDGGVLVELLQHPPRRGRQGVVVGGGRHPASPPPQRPVQIGGIIAVGRVRRLAGGQGGPIDQLAAGEHRVQQLADLAAGRRRGQRFDGVQQRVVADHAHLARIARPRIANRRLGLDEQFLETLGRRRLPPAAARSRRS